MACLSCKGWGCIVATDLKFNRAYAFQCPCRARNDHNKNFPMWNDCLKFHYKADFLDPLPDPKQATADQVTLKSTEVTDKEDDLLPF